VAHIPVLLDRAVELLAPALEGHPAVMVDATLGMGGHTEALLQAFPQLIVVGVDRDPEALRRSTGRLAPFADRLHTVHARYDEAAEAAARLGFSRVDGFLFDLGVSSLQLDLAERGFSYAHDAPLDMRMDPTQGVTAEEVLNTYTAGELARVLRVYGEEKFAPRIAAAIVRERQRTPLTSSARLVELVREAIPAPARRTGGNPAKRTFQALRIEVNQELAALEAALPAALAALRVGGRIVVMAYQSLEDRMVKQALAKVVRGRTPAGLPVDLPGHGPTFRLLTRGAEEALEAEVAANPRAASVRLRAAERLSEEGK
jgi:16S rRNA (cytosine1402-N4)-methyltransferase